MALVNCPKCGKEVSDKAFKCPHCEASIRRNGNRKKILFLIVIVLIVIITSVIGGIKYNNYQKQKIAEQEAARQRQISELLFNASEYNKNLDFDNVLKCYDKLDELYYDTADLRVLLDYDKNASKVIAKFLDTLYLVDEKLHNETYSPLSATIQLLKEPMHELDSMEINENSVYGNFANDIKNNIMYAGLKSEFINKTDVDFDYGLTSWGFAYCMTSYTEELLKVEKPFNYTINK